MKEKQFLKLLLVLVLLLTYSCASDDDGNNQETDVAFLEELIIDDPGLFPTKFDFNPFTEQFIAGSVTRSSVGSINPETGIYTPFINDENLKSIPEIYVDRVNKRVIVSSGDIGVSTNSSAETFISVAYVGIYDLETGEKIAGINLHDLLPDEPAFLPNGIGMDDSGDIYVADTFVPAIYKIDGVTFEKSVFIYDSRLAPPIPGAASAGLIGLIHWNDHLIVSKEDDGVLYKIPLSNPSNMVKIETDIFPEAKGLELLENGDIAVTVGGVGTEFTGVRILSTNDDWNSATVVSSIEISPAQKHPVATTIASDGELYVINSYFPESFSGNLSVDFSIERVNY